MKTKLNLSDLNNIGFKTKSNFFLDEEVNYPSDHSILLSLLPLTGDNKVDKFIVRGLRKFRNNLDDFSMDNGDESA